MMNRLLLLLGMSVVLAGCASDPVEPPRVMVPVTTALGSNSEVRNRGIVKEYDVGRVRDKDNPAILHEAHTVYEVAKEPAFQIARNPIPDPNRAGVLTEELEAKLREMEEERQLVKATLSHLIQTNTALAKGTTANAQNLILIEAKLAELTDLLERATEAVAKAKEAGSEQGGQPVRTGEANDTLSEAVES